MTNIADLNEFGKLFRDRSLVALLQNTEDQF